jgi:hypothetical protein
VSDFRARAVEALREAGQVERISGLRAAGRGPSRDEPDGVFQKSKPRGQHAQSHASRGHPKFAFRSGAAKADNTKLVALVGERCDAYFAREVAPHWPDAWIDYSKTKVGYEIPINRHFYIYEAPHPLAEIERDIKALEGEILQMLVSYYAVGNSIDERPSANPVIDTSMTIVIQKSPFARSCFGDFDGGREAVKL